MIKKINEIKKEADYKDAIIKGGANAVLTYNMVTHQVGVSNDTYIIYDTITHRVYKVKFDDYSGGVVIFRFMELSLY